VNILVLIGGVLVSLGIMRKMRPSREDKRRAVTRNLILGYREWN
jgi:hypothetical protein